MTFTCPNGHEIPPQTELLCSECGAGVVHVPIAALLREIPWGDRVAVDPIMLMYAFRYALGRMTYAVGDVVDALIEHRDALRPEWRTQIVERITEAVNGERAGMETDVEKWMQVVSRFEAMT